MENITPEIENEEIIDTSEEDVELKGNWLEEHDEQTNS